MDRTILAFATPKLEKQFFAAVAAKDDEEQGGICFFNWGRVNNLHWRTHKRVFGESHFGLITDWLICPNVSNRRHVQYAVSDYDQLLAIAEETASARQCLFIHWHTHPGEVWPTPSETDKSFWRGPMGGPYFDRGVIATTRCAYTFEREPGAELWRENRFASWKRISRVLRREAQRK